MARKNVLTDAVLNVFCPTGIGGGIKPNCGLKSGGTHGGGIPSPPLGTIVKVQGGIYRVTGSASNDGKRARVVLTHEITGAKKVVHVDQFKSRDNARGGTAKAKEAVAAAQKEVDSLMRLPPGKVNPLAMSQALAKLDNARNKVATASVAEFEVR